MQSFSGPRDNLHGDKFVVVMVGLPARGKSYVSHKLVNFLKWRGNKARLFNVGQTRRAGRAEEKQAAEFFDSSNAAAKVQREQMAMQVLEELLTWLDDGGEVGVFDATNTTPARRAAIVDHCMARSSRYRIIFVECECDRPEVLESNFRQKCRHSPDFRHMPIEQAMKDLRRRVSHYEKVYQPVADHEGSYIRLTNLQSKVSCHQIFGALPQRMAVLFMSLHIHPRPIWLVRAGEAPLVALERDRPQLLAAFLRSRREGRDLAAQGPGGEAASAGAAATGEASAGSAARGAGACTGAEAAGAADEAAQAAAPAFAGRMPSTLTSQLHLSAAGRQFALALRGFLQERMSYFPLPLQVHASTLPRARETAAIVCGQQSALATGTSTGGGHYGPAPGFLDVNPAGPALWSALNPLDSGVLHGMAPEEVRQQLPVEWEAWRRRPFEYRFPGGESYKDLIARLEPLVTELERETRPTLVVSHLSTLRMLYAYFLGVPHQEVPSVDIPPHTLVELTPDQYGWTERRFPLSPAAPRAKL